MVGLTTLWLPILLSAVLVFIASSIIHTLLNYHWTDWDKIPGEDNVLEALRKEGVGQGNYTFPRPASRRDMRSPELMEKCKRYPMGFLTVFPGGTPTMGKSLVQWFVYTLVVSFFVAYLAGRTLGAGVEYLRVFRVAGAVSFMAYAGAEPVASIWFGRKWSATLKSIFDGLVYALLTAGVFSWLWPS